MAGCRCPERVMWVGDQGGIFQGELQGHPVAAAYRQPAGPGLT